MPAMPFRRCQPDRTIYNRTIHNRPVLMSAVRDGAPFFLPGSAQLAPRGALLDPFGAPRLFAKPCWANLKKSYRRNQFGRGEMYTLTYLQLMALRLRKDKSGAVATEYAFLIAFIAIVAAIGMALLGENLSAFFFAIGEALANAGDAIPDLPTGT